MPDGFPGGNYKWRDNGDGTFDLLDVPIVGEIPAGLKGNKRAIDKPWLLAALERARDRLKQDSFLAPTHVLHHEFGTDTQPAGFVLPTKVGRHTYEGKSIWALFADLKRLPARVFEAIKNLTLPYRSIEVHKWEIPEVNSLALLDDEVPFFRFPLTSAGQRAEAEITSLYAAPGLCGVMLTAGSTMALFKLGGDKMQIHKFDPNADPMAELKAAEDKAQAKAHVDEVIDPLRADAGGKLACGGARDLCNLKEEESEEVPPEPTGDEAPPPPADAVPAEAVADPAPITLEEGGEGIPPNPEVEMTPEIEVETPPVWAQEMISILQAIAATVAGAGAPMAPAAMSAGAQAEPEVPVENEDVLKNDLRLAEAKGEAAKLRADAIKRDQKDEVEKLAADKITEIEGMGYFLDDDHREEIHTFAAMGEEALSKFTSAFTRSAPVDPPPSLDLFEAGGWTNGADPAEVLKFSNRGPDLLAKARSAHKEYAELKARNKLQPSMTLERYLEVSVGE